MLAIGLQIQIHTLEKKANLQNFKGYGKTEKSSIYLS